MLYLSSVIKLLSTRQSLNISTYKSYLMSFIFLANVNVIFESKWIERIDRRPPTNVRHYEELHPEGHRAN